MQARRQRDVVRGLFLLGVAMSCLMTGEAEAQPYEFFAVYEPASPAGEAHRIRFVPEEGVLLPDGGESHQLDRIVVRFKADGISASNLSAFSSIKFVVSLGEAVVATTEIPTAGIEKLPDRESTLLSWRGDGKSAALVKVKIKAQSIYSSIFLCLQEMLLIEKSNPTEEFKVPLRGGKAGETADDARKRIRAENGGPTILFTFCKDSEKKDRNLQVDWDKAAEDTQFMFFDSKLNEKQDIFRMAHKRALANRISTQMNEQFATFGRTAVVETDDARFENVLIQVGGSRSFSVIKGAGALLLAEESGGSVNRLADIIDQDSEVALTLDRDVCFQLSQGELMRTPWVFELEVPDKTDSTKTKTSKIDLEFRNGCNRILRANWKDYLNQRVTFRVIYRVPEHEDIVVFKDSFQIYNLGLITTAPVISEIISAIQDASPRDIEARSSIPVSWAISVRENRPGSYAVTFPFTLSLNTRSFPDLASYVALAPSISLVGGGTAEGQEGREPTSLRAAFGLGVNLARAFHFGYAWAPSDGSRYVLIGISVPDLLPLLKTE